MDEIQPAAAPQSPQAPTALICPVCHEPVLPTYYFCPNCGAKLANAKPLSISVGTQAWIYIFSIILPAIAFLAIKYWPGVKYLQSPDWERKQVGIVAIVLMVASTALLTWWGIVWIEGFVSSSTGGLMGGTSNLGF
ncbi:MAG: zinc ribbon domain-containing protein [Minisyncoccia bacterium]|jgi:hypothetical protein